MAGSNLILIGMPGAGKSTIGVILAKLLALDFLDTDLIIQCREQKTLQQIVDEQGSLALRKIESDVLSELECESTVVATGGSAVYSPTAMAHLKTLGQVLFLHVSLTELKSRLLNVDTRGLARQPGQSFEDLFHERNPLYEQYADLRIPCDGQNPEQISHSIVKQLRGIK